MADYFLAPALVALRDETNKAYPKRDKTSDGWIGDASHAARVSDHNPCWVCAGRSAGIVRAIDIDVTPDGEPLLDLRDAVLRATIGDPRVWYVITDGKIYSRTHGWQARVYTGNPHAGHVHVSLNGANGLPGDPGNFDTAPWGLVKGQQPPAKDKRLPRVSLDGILTDSRRPRAAEGSKWTRRVQRALNAKAGARLTIDGVYGPSTRAAYAAWQRRQGLRGNDADGIPGLQTLTALGRRRFRVTR